MSEAHWRVVVDDRARKDLRRIDHRPRARILSAIQRLAQGAELAGDIKRLRGSGDYRLRVGDWARTVRTPDPPTQRSSSCVCCHVAARMTADASRRDPRIDPVVARLTITATRAPYRS